MAINEKLAAIIAKAQELAAVNDEEEVEVADAGQQKSEYDAAHGKATDTDAKRLSIHQELHDLANAYTEGAVTIP